MVISSPLYLDSFLPSCDFCGRNCKTKVPFRKILAIGQSKWWEKHAGWLGGYCCPFLLGWCLRPTISKLGCNYWKCWATFFSLAAIGQYLWKANLFLTLRITWFPFSVSWELFAFRACHLLPEAAWEQTGRFSNTCKFPFLLEPFPSCFGRGHIFLPSLICSQSHINIATTFMLTLVPL